MAEIIAGALWGIIYFIGISVGLDNLQGRGNRRGPGARPWRKSTALFVILWCAIGAVLVILRLITHTQAPDDVPFAPIFAPRPQTMMDWIRFDLIQFSDALVTIGLCNLGIGWLFSREGAASKKFLGFIAALAGALYGGYCIYLLVQFFTFSSK